ncbi:MAG: biotin-dependent carboxyltransferase family protein [Dinoroseobacter sp.]|nr:biotin-dependent carboxyltransferase family protein [Dinoroseobacter sp.]
MTSSDSCILIQSAGPATTVQDLGRFQLRRLGIPVAGTLCPDWLFLGNGLLGNAPNAAVLEFRLLGPRFLVEAEKMQAVVAGPAEMQVVGPSGNRKVPPWTVASLVADDVVSIGSIRSGTVALLCLSGGVDTPIVLGSRATYERAGLGGFRGRALKSSDRVPIGTITFGAPLVIPKLEDPTDEPIRVILGPQEDHFPQDQVDAFLRAHYTVTTQLDRMGMRLEGPPLRHRAPELSEIVSDGIVPGAVQVPGSGQPIILLADGQTVGGYPKIATIISADLPRLSRLAPGAKVAFRAVSVAVAEAALEAHTTRLQGLLSAAVPARADGEVSLQELYSSNLVSGVVDGKDL